MIKIEDERLIPLQQVPDYLASRGFHRVSIHAVYRWTRSGSRGVRLESLRIGGQKVTSIEAIQRWVEARERVETRPKATRPVEPERAAKRAESTQRTLIEMRLEPTELDVFFKALKVQPESTRSHVANALFRAGLRCLEDVRKRPIEVLLDLDGIGPKSEPIVRRLKREADLLA